MGQEVLEAYCSCFTSLTDRRAVSRVAVFPILPVCAREGWVSPFPSCNRHVSTGFGRDMLFPQRSTVHLGQRRLISVLVGRVVCVWCGAESLPLVVAVMMNFISREIDFAHSHSPHPALPIWPPILAIRKGWGRLGMRTSPETEWPSRERHSRMALMYVSRSRICIR